MFFFNYLVKKESGLTKVQIFQFMLRKYSLGYWFYFRHFKLKTYHFHIIPIKGAITKLFENRSYLYPHLIGFVAAFSLIQLLWTVRRNEKKGLLANQIKNYWLTINWSFVADLSLIWGFLRLFNLTLSTPVHLKVVGQVLLIS